MTSRGRQGVTRRWTRSTCSRSSASSTSTFQPKIVGDLNDHQVKVVKLQGDFVWHHHETEDELFLVVRGRMRMGLRTGDIELSEGELFIVPKGVEHKPSADGGVLGRPDRARRHAQHRQRRRRDDRRGARPDLAIAMATRLARLPGQRARRLLRRPTCIDCDTCRRDGARGLRGGRRPLLRPRAARRPRPDRRRALMALVACPTASIGTVSQTTPPTAPRPFRRPIDENVSFCGFTAESSFGAWSYFVERPGGQRPRRLAARRRAAAERLSRRAAASRRSF